MSEAMILSLYNVQYTEYLNGRSQFKWPQCNLCIAFVCYHTACWLVQRRLKVNKEICACYLIMTTVCVQVSGIFSTNTHFSFNFM